MWSRVGVLVLLAGVAAAAQNPSPPGCTTRAACSRSAPSTPWRRTERLGELKSGDLGALRTRNEAFDGSRHTLLLSGAQHQEVAVQIVIPVAGKRYAARLIALEGVPADRVTFSTIAWSRKIPDVILPLDGIGCEGCAHSTCPSTWRACPESTTGGGCCSWKSGFRRMPRRASTAGRWPSCRTARSWRGSASISRCIRCGCPIGRPSGWTTSVTQARCDGWGSTSSSGTARPAT